MTARSYTPNYTILTDAAQIRLLKSVSFIEAQLRAEGKASMPNDEPGVASDVYETLHAGYRDYDLKMSKAEDGNAVTFLSVDYLGARL